MRSYSRNSPEAAARIVALVLIADGHVCRSEFDVLHRPDAFRMLGLAPDALHRIVQDLCEDLVMGAYAAGSMLASIDAATLASIMAEVDEPALQRKVLEFAIVAAHADQTLAEGEAMVLEAAARHWNFGRKAAAVEESASFRPVR
jgi:hypothetical protein